MKIQEISLRDIEGIRLGNAQNREAMTGVSVLLFDKKVEAGIDISGGGPASRETPLLDPKMNCSTLNAIVFSGGSAFGLDAGGGVMEYLEEHEIGFHTGFATVPLVCQSCIFDLGIGDASVRPDKAMGYAACVDAEAWGEKEIRMGNVGAGCGATVGKLKTMEQSMKSGLGIYAVSIGTLQMAAVVVVNALGDIFNGETGEKIAGMRNDDRSMFLDCEAEMYRMLATNSGNTFTENTFTGNTTIGAVITNGKFSKGDMNKIASMTRGAYGKCIRPVGTMADGDTIYAVATGKVEADINLAGTLAVRVMSEAIKKAVESSYMEEETYRALFE